ncbi:hypothetical protein, partial [Parachitinimonas caeni]
LTPNRGPNLPTAKPLYGKLRLGKSPVVMIDPQFQRPEAPPISGMTDQLQIHRSRSYNEFGELAEEMDGNGNRTVYDYQQGRLVAKTAGVNGNGELLNQIDEKGTPANAPKGSRTDYRYTDGGRIQSVTDARGS